MSTQPLTTLERIHQAARQEFLAKGFQRASLRKIVQSVGMTTGAFYGYYRSKADLFAALVARPMTTSWAAFSRPSRPLLPCRPSGRWTS